jgi:hypothetical protein
MYGKDMLRRQIVFRINTPKKNLSLLPEVFVAIVTMNSYKKYRPAE